MFRENPREEIEREIIKGIKRLTGQNLTRIYLMLKGVMRCQGEEL
jgi:hypothetical protein